MYQIYRTLTLFSTGVLALLLAQRSKAGKEIPERLNEKKGIPSLERPSGKLTWVHAASVGEAQSALILIDRLLEHNPDSQVLVTTGTVTSAQLMDAKLPEGAFHQFYPLDHPSWVKRFLDHWKPDNALWLESELWPNMLHAIKKRNIPAVLVNARLSEKSFLSWSRFRKSTAEMLSTFQKVLCQTDLDKTRFDELGATNTITTDNIKFSAKALGFDESAAQAFADAVSGRPLWVYASTHKAEEKIACDVHTMLKTQFPTLLTIVVPRHPERRDEIKAACSATDSKIRFRGTDKKLPGSDDDVYIADTLGELGLFYNIAPIACIGRSFSDDGGGGHNPIEAAQLGCAVLHGPNVQNLQEIFNDMNNHRAAFRVATPQELIETLTQLFTDEGKRSKLQNAGIEYARRKNQVINHVMKELEPILV